VDRKKGTMGKKYSNLGETLVGIKKFCRNRSVWKAGELVEKDTKERGGEKKRVEEGDMFGKNTWAIHYG